MKTVVLLALILVAVVAYETTIVTPTADEIVSPASKVASKDYFYLGGSYTPVRVIKYSTEDGSRQQHIEYQPEQNVTRVHRLALNVYGTVLYALLQTSIEGQYAISIINVKDMSQIKYTTISLARPSTIFVTSRHLCIVNVDKETTLLRYSYTAEFIDSTVIVSPLDEGVSAFELIDRRAGILFLKDSTGIKRFDVNRLAWFPTLPVDWKAIGVVSFSSLAMVKDTIYIVNKQEPVINGACNDCWYLHTVTTNGTSSTLLGAYSGVQPELVNEVLSENEIVAFGRTINRGRYDVQRPVCVINTISQKMNCYELTQQFMYVATNMIHVSTSKQYYFSLSATNMIQMNPENQTWISIPYSPNTYRARNNNDMQVVGDQLFYCSSEFLTGYAMDRSGLVAMNLVTGQIRILQDFSCKTLVAYENKLYLYRYNNASVKIMSVDVDTLQVIPVKDECPECTFLGIYAIPGRGVYFKALSTEGNVIKRILQDGTAFAMPCEPYSETTPRGLCIKESDDYIFDDTYQYVISRPGQFAARQIYRYNVASNDMRILQYASNPLSECENNFKFVLDPKNVPGKRYGYLICDKVVKFDLITGEVKAVYLNGNAQVRATTLAIHGDNLWVSGQSSNTFTVVSDKEIAPINWWYLSENSSTNSYSCCNICSIENYLNSLVFFTSHRSLYSFVINSFYNPNTQHISHHEPKSRRLI
jgi:hypothetical protein